MLISIMFIVVGAALLIKGADMLVDGGAGIALKSGVSHLVVGLTVVAFGTSAPELAASLSAALKGSGGICFGNVVGSNVANIALILGVTSLVLPVAVNRLLIRWEIPFMIFVTIPAMIMGYMGYAGRAAGIVLLALFAVYLAHCMKSPPVPIEVEDSKAQRPMYALILMAAFGIAGLSAGGMLFVNGSRDIAAALGVSETVIGLTIVALGTSLPELITSVVAAIKGHADISLGNIVGSNIFNILLVLGTTSVIKPFVIDSDRFLAMVGMPLMLVLAAVLLPFSMSGKIISRIEGVFFTLVYIVYIALAVVMA